MYRRRLASDHPATIWFRPINGPIEPIPTAALKPLDEVEKIRVAQLVARAPRPRLKPLAAPTAAVIPAEYQSESSPLPLLKPDAAVRLAAEQLLPQLKPESVGRSAHEQPLPELKPDPGLRLVAGQPLPELKPGPPS